MPQQESRVKKSLLNARVNLIFYFLTLILSFFSRKIFLDTLGADFVGLTGTLQNLLGFLNLAELGIGSAIGYVLYKPLFEHDEGKINEIISVFGYLYRWIGFIILGAGLILACFLPLIFPKTQFEMGLIFFAYFSFLASSLIGYFANYKQTLLGADQKNYVVTAYFQTGNIVKVLIQMASAYYTGSYYLWVIIELTFGIIYSIILNWKINQVYPWLRSEVRLGKQLFKKYPEVMKYTKQLFVHRISTFVQFQTTPFLVYAFVSLQTVAYYGNYTIVTDKVSQLLNNLLSSTGAGVGNLIAEGNKEKIEHVFWELISIRFFITGILLFSLYNLLPPFITLWLGPQYLLANSVLILMLFSFFIGMTRGATDQFLYGYGLFYDTWAPVAESVIFIVVAIIGGHIWGLSGVLLGGIVSSALIIGIWKPYFLFSKGFELSVWHYWRRILYYIILTIFSFFVVDFIVSLFIDSSYSLEGWGNWILYSVVITGSFSLFYFGLLYIGTKEMRTFLNRVLKWKR
ncbi:sugar transporter [Barnesiella viscericola DSM 18177]|uniref:Sugar transporter n=1 Tax=Barnesiella viscericola DSM 18177 TaxID=880074 RepID=W0EL23_9BACT|nr:sugar transporter [Barnesiella viscericola]AHF11560.1 sugar transporter [Barnesiella viscericola DSM 18177]